MRIALATSALALSTLSNCLDPTEVVVELRTDVACSVVAQNGVTIAVGRPGDDQNGISTETSSCDGGSIGTLVVTPSGDIGESLGVRVTLGVNTRAEQCVAPAYSGCIVARRSLRYSPHTPLSLPIELDQDCLDRQCDPSSTCVHGSCVDAGVTTCPNDICSLPDAGTPVPDAGTCTSDGAPVMLTQDTIAATPRIARSPNGYMIAWVTKGNQLWAQTVSAQGTTVSTAVQVAQLAVGATFDGLATDGKDYVVLYDLASTLHVDHMSFQGVPGTTASFGTGVGPLGGFFYDPQQNAFYTIATIGGGTQIFVVASSSFQTGGAVTSSSVTGLALARAPTSYFASMHDANACYVYSCAQQPPYTFTCFPSVPINGCTGIRIAANATDRVSMQWLGTQLVAYDELTAQTTTLGAADSPDAFMALATGSTPFRGFWRTGDGLNMQTFPPTLTITALDSMGYQAAGGTGPGFDVVADDELTSTGFAVAYFKNNALWFMHRCN